VACSAGAAEAVPRAFLSSAGGELSPLSSLSAVCRSAATASPPVRADLLQSTASQGRAGGGGLMVGARSSKRSGEP
jgi:hypothetical protein